MAVIKWRAIPGYDGYMASSDGRIRSNRARRHQKAKPHIMKPWRLGGRYLQLRLMKNRKKEAMSVHVLIASAFHGKRPFGAVVNHKDGDGMNNSHRNLEWVTYKQNALHTLRYGRHATARMVMRSDGVKFQSVIQAARASGVSNKTIAMQASGIQTRRPKFLWRYTR